MLKFYEGKIHDVAPDILTEFHPWMESVFLRLMVNLRPR